MSTTGPEPRPGFGSLLRSSFAPLMHRLAFGLLLLGLALTAGGTEEGMPALTIAGVVFIALGTWGAVAAWRRRGYKLGYIGIVVGLVGVIFVGAAFDDANCDCRSMVWFGGSLVVIGAAGAIGRAFKGEERA